MPETLAGAGANRPSPPRDLADYPVGVPEIAAMLRAAGWPGATRRTVLSHIQRAKGGATGRRPHPFPLAQPTSVCGGSWWWASTIEEWLVTTESAARAARAARAAGRSRPRGSPQAAPPPSVDSRSS